MKRIIAGAIITGMVAVPSIALAQHRADDVNVGTNVRQEDRRQDRSLLHSSDGMTTATSVPSNNRVQNRSSDDNSTSTVATTSATISSDAATTAAQAVSGDKAVAKVELEHEHGVLVYSVRFTDGSRVDVSASDGSIVRNSSVDGQSLMTEDKGRHGSSHENDDSTEDDSRHHGGGDNSGRDHAEDN